MGSKKKPFYRIVVVDSRKKRDGKYLDVIGFYNPITKPMTITIKEDKVEKWLSKGVIPTDTVKNLLQKVNFFEKQQLKKQGLSEEEIEAKLASKETKLEKPKKKKQKAQE